MDAKPPAPAGPSARARIGSFIGWAFLLSLAIHAVLLPFVHLKEHTADKEETEKVSVSKKIKVQPPTPPPPTPTPPPPTPPPKSTPPPVKQTNPPPVKKLVIHPPKQTAQSKTGPSERKADVSKPEAQDGVPQGTVASAAPAVAAPVSTAPPAPPAPTPTPKPACANPNAPAAIKGSPVEPEYPDIAREQGAVGTALIKVTLSAEGSVTDVSVNKSAGNAALDKAAMDAAKSTSYVAETTNCVPTAGSYLFQADFTGQ
jgi:protein TonB